MRYAFLQDPGVGCLCYSAFALWFLGYPDQALKRIDEAVTLARNLSHYHSLAFALAFAAQVHQFRGEAAAAQEQAEAAVALSAQQGFKLWLAQATITRGWALAEQGQEEGIAQIHEGSSAWRTTGAGAWRSYHLGLLAEVYRKDKHVPEGLAAIAEALAILDKATDRLYEGEIYRLKGELTLKQTRFENLASTFRKKAEECFHKAVEIARRQGARSLELRALTSISRMWQQQGKQDEARKLLAEIYNWFTEGFDTADLKEAKALLDELSD